MIYCIFVLRGILYGKDYCFFFGVLIMCDIKAKFTISFFKSLCALLNAIFFLFFVLNYLYLTCFLLNWNKILKF